MAEIDFIKTEAKETRDIVLEALENGCNEPLYPGDERRIFGDALAQVVVAIYNKVNDASRQRLLRYARGKTLDALGENRGVPRLSGSFAKTTLTFGIHEPVASNIIVPAGTRVTEDFVRYFITDSTVVLPAGMLAVDVTATAEKSGAEYNGIAAGQLANIVDVSDVPLIDYVTNIDTSIGGGDKEGDEEYRERIREAENKLSTAGTAKAYKYWALTANARVSDVGVGVETERVSRTLKTYAAHAFQGGANLLPDTLVVYLPDGSAATEGTDYTATYKDELLTLELKGALAAVETVNIEITRNMYGRVKIVPICAGGELPDETVLADVTAVCTSDDVKPLTDFVTVEAPAVENYDIELTYYTTKENESEVIENVEGADGAINRYIYWQGSALKRDINPDELRKRILMPDWEEGLAGATRLEIVKPEYKKLNSTTVAKFSGKLTVKHEIMD